MNCPNPKHRKPVKLYIARTHREGAVTRREGVCKKCKGRYWTVEMFEDKFNGLISQKDHEVAKMRAEKNDAESQVDEIKDCMKTLVSLVDDK